MRVLFLSKDDSGKYTKWAECDNDAAVIELLKYFAGSCRCEDFICYFEDYPGCKKPFAVKLPDLCKAHNIEMKYYKEAKENLGSVYGSCQKGGDDNE